MDGAECQSDFTDSGHGVFNVRNGLGCGLCPTHTRLALERVLTGVVDSEVYHWRKLTQVVVVVFCLFVFCRDKSMLVVTKPFEDSFNNNII